MIHQHSTLWPNLAKYTTCSVILQDPGYKTMLVCHFIHKMNGSLIAHLTICTNFPDPEQMRMLATFLLFTE